MQKLKVRAFDAEGFHAVAHKGSPRKGKAPLSGPVEGSRLKDGVNIRRSDTPKGLDPKDAKQLNPESHRGSKGDGEEYISSSHSDHAPY